MMLKQLFQKVVMFRKNIEERWCYESKKREKKMMKRFEEWFEQKLWDIKLELEYWYLFLSGRLK